MEFPGLRGLLTITRAILGTGSTDQQRTRNGIMSSGALSEAIGTTLLIAPSTDVLQTSQLQN